MAPSTNYYYFLFGPSSSNFYDFVGNVPLDCPAAEFSGSLRLLVDVGCMGNVLLLKVLFNLFKLL